MQRKTDPRFALLFITLPQALLAAFLVYTFQTAGMAPSLPLLIVFGVQILYNIFVVVDVFLPTTSVRFGKASAIMRLAALLCIISAALPFMLRQFDFASSFSPETIYAVLCMIPLVYIAASLHVNQQTPRMSIALRIILCACLPLLFALVPVFGVWFSSFNIDILQLADSLADTLLILLFALFFVFVFLLTSVLYHFRVKRKTRRAEQETADTDSPKRHPGYIALVAITSLFLPLLCLGLNAGVNLVGNFTSPWFFILVIINGAAMLVPRVNKWVVLVALFFKGIGFLYVLYIAAALLLPFLPLALALFYAILPLLLLTPFVLLIIELLQIISDFAYLKKHFRLLPLCAVFTCGMLALCGGFVGSCFAHKVNFNNALCYLSTEQEQYPDVNLGRLKTSLSNARQQGSRGLFDININQRGLPLLDVAYQGIVMDGKSLSQEVYDRMAQIFVPELASWDMVNRDKFRGGSPEVNLTDINTETQYDAEAKLYRTWVHLQLTNNSAIHNQEYAVLFDLPEGIFITDYYLDVFGEKKHGILSEKVSAKAVYESIVNRNRDPGIISYYNSGAIELRVFPFAPNETRETGFLLMHKYASGEQIKIGNYEFVLEGEDAGEPILTDDVCYMPGSYKQNLQKLDEMTARKPKYYFVLDVGQTQTSLNDILYDTAENLIRRYAAKNALPDDTVVYLTAYNVEKTDLAHMNPRTRDGGFNLGLAVEMIRRDVANHPESYPVIIAATNRFDFAISADSQKLARDYPQSEYYYLLNNDASLTTYSFADNSVQWAQETPAAILVYEGFYFKDNGQSEVSYSNAIAFDDLLPQVDDLYTNALLLQGKAEKAEVQEHVIEALKGSIAQRVLTKQSAFIVLETKEQEDELNRRNQEFLDGKVIAGPPRAAMSEPGAALAMLAVIVVLGVGIIKRRIVRQRKLT